MRLLVRFGAVVAAIAMILLPSNPAFAAYHYATEPASDNILGVEFHVITEYDDVTGHLRAEGIIQATGSGHAGRIFYVSLFAWNQGSHSYENVANFVPDGGVATTGFLSVIAGPVECNDYSAYATMKYHVDGTSETRTMQTTVYSQPVACP